MKKIAVIIVCVLIGSCAWGQTKHVLTQQEIGDRFNKFNTELNAVYGKDLEKSIKLLDDMVVFCDSIPLELRGDSAALFCQFDFLYFRIYTTHKDYGKATDYVKKMGQSECNQFYSVLTSDEFSELRQQPQMQEMIEKAKNSADYKFALASQKLNKSIEKKDYKQNIEIISEALGLYDSLKIKDKYALFYLQIQLSMSYSALNNKTEALKYLKKATDSGYDYSRWINRTEFDNIRTTKEFAELIDTTLTAPELKPGAWELKNDLPVKASSATASNAQPGEGAARSIDGNMATLYHSSWTHTVFPVELKYTFLKPEIIDYMIYCPRTEGSNGNFKEVEILVSENGRETLIGKYNFEGKGTPTVINLKGKKPGYIKVIVKSGMGDNETGFASCAEMQFFRKNANNKVHDVFLDNTCSALKKVVKEGDINSIVNPQFKALAKALYNNTYDKRYRIKDYKPYPNPTTIANKNKTGTYSLLDNATGIVAMPGEEIVVFVGKTNGQSIALRSINFNNDYSPVDYMLKEGANSIICKDGGLLYVMYHTDDANAQPIKVHIATGKVNGMYNSAENTNSDWKAILDSAKHKYIDVQGKFAHLVFPVSDFKKYTPDVSQLVNAFDSIVYLESRFIGLEKYNRMNGNRMLFYVSTWALSWGAGGFASANRIGCSVPWMPDVCNVNKLRTTAIWGPAHEIGHINQTRGLKWVGLTEVSNNIYSMYVQAMFGNKSRLEEEKLNSDFDGVWNNRYEKGFSEMLTGKILHSDHGDVFCKLIPFWQLQLYFSNVKGYTDFYADVHEQIRNMNQMLDDVQQQLNFMRICCDVSKTDLSEFFERWGMLAVTSGEAVDHSSIQNKVNYTKSFKITKEDIAEFKKQVSKYPKPEANIWYIHDECVDAFKNKAPVEKGKLVVDGANCETDTKNAVVFEVYDGDKPVFITPKSKFKIPGNCKNPVVYAAPAVGKHIAL